jgi:hypothetical protein
LRKKLGLQTKIKLARQLLMQTSNIKFNRNPLFIFRDEIYEACKRGVEDQTIQILKGIELMSTENAVQSSL